MGRVRAHAELVIKVNSKRNHIYHAYLNLSQISSDIRCPSIYPSITSRFALPEPFNLSDGAAVLQAYSAIAHFATQSDIVVDADKEKMEKINKILNGLIRNYFEAVSIKIARHSLTER